MSVPMIDVSALRAGDPAAAREAAARIDDALVRIGFFAVTGHGVDPALRDALRASARAFFDLPDAEKQRAQAASGSISRGYVATGRENLGLTLGEARTHTDLKEQLAFGPLDAREPPMEPNVWPGQPTGLADTVRAWYRAMEALAADLLRGFALALDMPPGYFAPFFDRHGNVLRVLHYPDQSGRPPAPGETRSGAHTDYGALTILMAEDAPGGLQVKLRDGEWVDVRPPADAFVVNIGDLMAMWTNDRWISNLHRVANPPPDAGASSRRLSAAYFVNANPDARIACIPSCAAAGNAPKYPPVLAGEHRAAKIARSRGAPAPLSPPSFPAQESSS